MLTPMTRHQTITDEARDLLAATPIRDLLQTAYRLTHFIHTASATADDTTEGPFRRKRAADRRDEYRAQRDLITAEIERRTEGL